MSRKAFPILAILASFTAVALAPASSSVALTRTSEFVAVPSEVVIGTEINVSMIDIEHNAETKKATSCVVYTPTGARINSTNVSFTEPGKYVFVFSAMFGDEVVTKSQETMSVRTPASMFSGSNASVSQGSFAYNDKLDGIVGVSDYKGIKVSSKDGGVVTFNKVLDFSKATINDAFIDFIVEPSTPGAYDTGEIVITLTDADDSNNIVDIRFVDGLAGSGNGMRLTYASARASGQTYAGYENWAGIWHVDADQTGAPAFLTLRGLDDQIIADTGTGYLNSQLYFDYSSKQILTKSEYLVKNSKVLINDLDSSEIYSTNPWSGFKNGRAILSFKTNDVSGTGAKYIIKSIFGYDFSQELLRDNVAPKLDLDFNGEDRDNLPLAKKDNTYPIFKANVFDNFDDDLYFNTKVQYYDKTEDKYVDVVNDGKRFTTNLNGKYRVFYCCKDRSGNEAEDFYIVNCSSLVHDITIDVPEDLNTHRAYEQVDLCPLSDVTVNNAQGKYSLKRYLISPDSSEVELKNDFFTPTCIGTYKIKYVVNDIYDSPVSKIVDFNILNITHPIIIENIALPTVVVKGQYFNIPRVGCKYPNGEQIADGEVEVRVNETAFSGDRMLVESLDDIHIDYIPHSSIADKVSFTLKVVEGTDSSGRTIKNNYFYSSDTTYEPKSEDTENKAMQFTLKSDAEVNFIKSISSNDLSLSFGIDEATMLNYESFNIKVRDKYDFNKVLTLKVVPNVNGLKLFVPLDTNGKDLSCDENKVFELYYQSYYKTLRDRDYKDICIIKCFDNGDLFTGFSEEVYVSFSFANLANPALISLFFINNQSFKTSIVKDNAGPQIVTDTSLNWANELGEEITIYKAKAYDVLSYVEFLNVTMTDSNGNYILNKADASVDHKVTLNKYGNYRIEYNSKDGNGRNSNRSFTICCIENEKPTLSVDFTPQEKYAVGSVLALPTYSFNDNSLNCTLDVCLYLPSGQGIAIEHATMRNGDVYKENYLDLDHYSSQLVQSNYEVKLYVAGKYRLRYLVVDAYGNVNLKEFVLNVG